MFVTAFNLHIKIVLDMYKQINIETLKLKIYCHSFILMIADLESYNC